MSKRHPNVPGLNTDHRGGKDPTPQGRTPTVHREGDENIGQDPEIRKFENSVPGPDVRQDGVYFYGYKDHRISSD